MLDLGFVSLLSLLAAGVGLHMLDRLGGRPPARLDALGPALPMGLGLLSLATLGLGQVGMVGRGGLAILLAISLLVGWALPTLPRARSGGQCPADDPLSCALNVFGFPDAAFALVLVVTIVGTLVTALAPVTD